MTHRLTTLHSLTLAMIALIAAETTLLVYAFSPMSRATRHTPFAIGHSPGQRHTQKFMVDSLTLDQLTDHETIGEELQLSIQKWLDAEWMPQEVHIRMGETCKETYIKCRESGQSELMSIMTQVADDLQAKWDEYDADAFVNAYDLANYVSDFLLLKAGNERCECSARIY